jgi:hypothetical protein
MRRCASLFLLASCVASEPKTLVVDLTSPPAPSAATVLAVQCCAGLMNRQPESGGYVYTLMRPEDNDWLTLVAPPSPVRVSPAELLNACLTASPPVAKGYILFNYSAQQLVVPNVLTLAGVLDAVVLESAPSTLALAFDATVAWANFSALQATQFMFDRHVNATRGVSKMNPGLDVHGHPLDPSPPLSLQPDLSLGDYIVKARLFNFFLAAGCIPGTQEHALMERIAEQSPWPRPLAVLGYDDTFPVAGDLFEAETNCVSEHNLGQVATTGVNNLALFSALAAPITTPLVQPPPLPAAPFNASQTYVSFVVGDGDNIAMVKGTRFQWMSERVKQCSSSSSSSSSSGGSGGATAAPSALCPPLVWTLSPHLAYLAPQLAQWFFRAAQGTGRDYFTLPPSGHTYSYPGSQGPADAAAFVAATEADAVLYNTSATVDWEWVGTWGATLANFTPRYAEKGIITALFAVNVPYMVPILEFGPLEFFKVFGGTTVLFKPNEWRGTGGSANPLLHPFLRNATEMAADLVLAPRGTVTAIYLTSDGGGDWSMFEQLAEALAGSHVQVVDHVTLARMALASRGK